MKSTPSICRFSILVVLIAVSIIVVPGAIAQVTIPAGGFTGTTVCASSSNPFPAGCQLAANGNAATTSTGILRLTNSTGNQIASVWALTPQTVSNGFTTTFTFRFSNPSATPGDGIAFVIQNAQITNTNSNPLAAIGYTLGTPKNGGSIGYGDDDANSATNSGIPNSIAVELDTFRNPWDTSAKHVAVQTCKTGYNTSHHNQNCGGGGTSTLGINYSLPINLTDGNVHTVTIQYNPPNTTPCDPTTPTAQLCVYLDKTTNTAPVVAVPVDISSIGLINGTAYVGFTSATGGSWETQDVTSWSYTQTVTEPLSTTGVTPLVFNGTPNETITHTLDYTNAGTVQTPLTNPQIQSTNVVVSDATDWPPYVIGTPYSVSHIFPKNGDAAIGGTGTGLKGSIFKNACFDATHPPADANCPIATTGFIVISDTFDTSNKPTIADGTTTALIEYVTNTIPSVTDWAPSSSTPNPACSNTLGTGANSTPAACDLLDILANTFGDATTVSGTSSKKGTFATVYGVPMPLTSVSVNGTALNNPPSNNNDTAGLWFKPPVNLSFAVNPACPLNTYPCGASGAAYNYFAAAPVAGETYQIKDLNGNTIVPSTQAAAPSGFGTTSVAPVTFTATPSLADGKYFLQFSAADNIGIVERHVQLFTAAGATCMNPDNTTTGSPCYQTTLFQSQLNVDSVPPAANCPTADTVWHAADVTVSCSASDATSGIGAATVSTAPGVPVGGGTIVNFNLQTTTAAGTANANTSTNTQTLCDLANNCSNAVVTGYKIDKAFPTIGTISFSPSSGVYAVGQKVTASFSCADVGSGLASCRGTGGIVNGGFIDTSTAGTKTFTVTAIDNAGNTTTSQKTYAVGDFTLTVTPTSQTIPSGHQAVYTVTVTPVGGLTGTVNLTCTDPAPNTSCVVTPSSDNLSGVALSSTVTLSVSRNVTHGTWTIVFTGTLAGSNVQKSVSVQLTIK